jgi:hypothetical protein
MLPVTSCRCGRVLAHRCHAMTLDTQRDPIKHVVNRASRMHLQNTSLYLGKTHTHKHTKKYTHIDAHTFMCADHTQKTNEFKEDTTTLPIDMCSHRGPFVCNAHKNGDPMPAPLRRLALESLAVRPTLRDRPHYRHTPNKHRYPTARTESTLVQNTYTPEHYYRTSTQKLPRHFEHNYNNQACDPDQTRTRFLTPILKTCRYEYACTYDDLSWKCQPLCKWSWC